MADRNQQHLSWRRNLKISFFHLGSGMADVLATGVWNRIMVADLGFSATLVGLLTGLRYFLAPLGVWAGRFSDAHTVGGFRRLFWIWLGRAMMALSTVSLGLATAELVSRARDTASHQPAAPMVWLTLVVSFLLFSLGSALSGSTFLALVYDRAAEHQRGRAAGLVWTFLLLGFTVGGIFFGLMLPSDEAAPPGAVAFSAQSVQTLFLVTAGLLALLWFFSLLGEEKRHSGVSASPERQTSLRRDLGLVWHSRPMRFFLFYLTLSMLFAFLQDTVLEPFAAQVFGMEARITNRFSAYWGSMAILGSFSLLFLSRRWPALTNVRMSLGGVWVLMLAYAVFAVSSLAGIRGAVTAGLILLGLGLGIWNIGTLGLMMDLSPSGRAGTFLGFWTLTVTLARGLGVAGGGFVRDVAFSLSGEFSVAYGWVFAAGFAGLLASWLALRRVRLADYEAGPKPDGELAAALAGTSD